MERDNKRIAQKEKEAIGGNPKVFRYWDEGERKYIDILDSANRPEKGVLTCATIGLSEYDTDFTSDGKDLRIELVGACDVKETVFPNLIATIAFEIMEKEECGYGDIIENVIDEYIEDTEMKHIYLTSPYLWDDLEPIEFDNEIVTWLLAVPVSERERVYAAQNGADALADLFEQKNIDIYNLHRKSCL